MWPMCEVYAAALGLKQPLIWGLMSTHSCYCPPLACAPPSRPLHRLPAAASGYGCQGITWPCTAFKGAAPPSEEQHTTLLTALDQRPCTKAALLSGTHWRYSADLAAACAVNDFASHAAAFDNAMFLVPFSHLSSPQVFPNPPSLIQ